MSWIVRSLNLVGGLSLKRGWHFRGSPPNDSNGKLHHTRSKYRICKADCCYHLCIVLGRTEKECAAIDQIRKQARCL